MEPEAVGDLLGSFQERSPGSTVTDETMLAWCEALAGIPDAIVASAVADYLGSPEQFRPSFPKLDAFRAYLSKANRAARRQAPTGACLHCDGHGWIDPARPRTGKTFPTTKYETVKPCEACDFGRPLEEGEVSPAYDEWHDRWRHENNHLYRETEGASHLMPPKKAQEIAGDLRAFLRDGLGDADDLMTPDEGALIP